MGSSRQTVCAVVPAGVDVRSQSFPVEAAVSLSAGRTDLADAVAKAAESGTDWIWLLDEEVQPAGDALARLLSPLESWSHSVHPSVLASKVVQPDGKLDGDALPWPRMLARELSLLGAEHRIVALRAVRYGSILVSRLAVERHGPPRPDFARAGDDLEWTGRILRDEQGFLVPQSIVARTQSPSVDRFEYIRNRVRILRGDAWSGQERVWFAYVLVSDVLREVIARPTGLPEAARALGKGVRASC